MKKLLLLFALMFTISAVWNKADARYNLGDRKAYDKIKVGDTIAIQGISDNANNGYRYIGAGILQTAFTDDCVYKVEEGPADIRTGDPTIFLRQIKQDKYLGHNGLRGKKPSGQNATQLVNTPDSAYNFALYCAADSSAEWNGQHNYDAASTVFCYSFSNDGELGHYYLCNWGYYEAELMRIWTYQDTNPWNVFTVYQTKDALGELNDLLDYYSSLDLDYTPGTDPGFYPQEYVNAYNSALEKATIAAMEEHTDAEYTQYAADLKAAREAVEANYIPITDGYYYIVSAYSNFLNSQKVEKACFMTSDNTYIQWKTIENKKPEFIFHVSKIDEGKYQVKSYNTDRYWKSSSANALSQPIQTTTKQETAQTFTAIGGGQWKIQNETYKIDYHPESNAGGSGKTGKLVTWNTSGRSSASTWYLRAIEDPKIIDSLDIVKAQTKLTDELKAVCSTASATYDKLFVYSADTLQPLITHVTDNDPSDNQLSSNASDPSEGQNLSYLIDKDPTTFWHSTWHTADAPKAYHYLQADISNTPSSSFSIYIRRREGTYGNYDRPTAVNIYATQDTTGQWNGTAKWTLVKTIKGMPTDASVYDYLTPGIEPGFAASYVRFEVIEKSNYPSRNNGGYPYFNLSEFQIYPVTLDKDASQYYYSTEMQEAAEALKALQALKEQKVADNTATQDDIDELTAAIKAVNNLYADTTALKKLITTCNKQIKSIIIGTGIGQAPSEDLVETFQAAITEAEGFDAGTGKLDKTAIDNAYNTLKKARFTFLGSLNLPKADAWYYISNLDQERSEDPEKITNGGVMYVKEYGQDKQLAWKINEGEELSYNPMAMWHFIPVEDEDYPLTYYIQNLGTGLYIGDYSTYSVPVKTSATPVLYQLNISGGQPGFIARKGYDSGYSLHAANSDNAIVGWSAGANTASAWDISEVDTESIDALTLTIKNNNIDVFNVPYELSGIAEINDGVITYGIKKMTLDKETDETTVELYEKDDFEAGEPCILVAGDPTIEETEDLTLVIPMPTTISTQTTNVANGIVGLIASADNPEGTAWFTGKEVKVSKATISAHTGYIDATKYQGEVEGVETARTLVIKGLNWNSSTAGDVDGDGEVSSSDVVAVYNYIQILEESGVAKDAADVNGDGEVNAADVVEVYNMIIGGDAKAGAFVAPAAEVEASSIVTADENTQALVTISVGSTDNTAKIPVSLILTNPELEITAAEATIVAPVDVKKFLYDDENEDFVYDDTDRWKKTHSAMMSAGTKVHGADGFFISIVSSKTQNFSGTDGAVCTVYFDGSELADGTYQVTMKDAIAVWSDKSNVTTYKNNNMTSTFTISGGKATGLNAIEAEEAAKAGKIITLDGKTAASAQKGQIYIINGKKVKF